MKNLYFFLFILLMWAGLTQQNAQSQQLETVYVLNEGAFLNANSSVTRFLPQTGAVTQNVFNTVNGRPLGDVANYGVLNNETLYIIVSNSDKIEVVNSETFVASAPIFIEDDGTGSPAKMALIDDDTGLVTNLTGNVVSFIDLNSGEITENVEVGSNPDGIVIANGKAYVAITEFGAGNQVAVIDLETKEVEMIDVHDNPQRVYLGPDENVWVLCTGNFGFDADFNFDPELETFGEIHIIDPEIDEVIDVIEVGGHPQRMVFNTIKNVLYVLNDGIQVVDLETGELEDELLREERYFSLAIWEGDEPRLFAGFAPNFSSAGFVDILSFDGEKLETFTTGIAPSHFVLIGDNVNTSIGGPELAYSFSLDQNYPNPFNPTTQISFQIQTATNLTLDVYNQLGQRISRLANGTYSPGSYSLNFDASNLSSGVYFYRLQTETGVLTRKMMLVK